MKKLPQKPPLVILNMLVLLLGSCNETSETPVAEAVKAMDLKRGNIIVCGPADKEFGAVTFETSCTRTVKKEFDLALALLHSFEYDEAEKAFAKIIDMEPQCAMAYWGVAMCNYHPLWAPPTGAELEKGAKAIAIAQSLSQKTARESAYIEAIATFYKDRSSKDHHTRTGNYEKAMEKIYSQFPDDKEAATFYALALTAAADPADKSFKNQKKAGAILASLHPEKTNHPGIIHYIIHTYDSPGLATLALPAARKYAAVAPSSAHALHMPSHIFTRLGLWTECINSNLASVSSAQCYAQSAGIKGHWDEELHGLDYLVYGYLQRGENNLAKKQVDYVLNMKVVHPANFKVAYAFASIPSRYVLENKLWTEAANLNAHSANFNWKDFPWQKAIIHYTRLLGSVHGSNPGSAKIELKHLNAIHDSLVSQKDLYKAAQVQVQVKSSEAWILLKEGKSKEAVEMMEAAAVLEDKTEKHPVTPSEIIPARELLADMLLHLKRPSEALEAYEEVLKKAPNRFNSLYGAGLAAEQFNDQKKATIYYQQLIAVTNPGTSLRPELRAAKLFLKRQSNAMASVGVN